MSALPVLDDEVIVRGDQVMAEVKTALERMNVGSDSRVAVKVTGGSIIVKLVADETRAADLKKAMDETHRRYAECFRALAK